MSKRSRRKARKGRTPAADSIVGVDETIPSQNSSTSGLQSARSGMGGGSDFGSRMAPLTRYRNRTRMLSQYYEMYRSFWEAAKIIDIPPGDMTREGWKWVDPDTEPDILAKLAVEEKRIKLKKTIKLALIYQRLYGGGVVLIGTKQAEDDPTTMAEELDVDSLGEGDIAFLRALPRGKITAVRLNNDPLSADYLEPEIYIVQGKEVHKSRLLVFSAKRVEGVYNSYDDLADGFGIPRLEGIEEDIKRAVGVRQSAMHLVQRASILALKDGRRLDLSGTTQGRRAAEKVEQAVEFASIYGAIVLEKDDDLISLATSFGSVPQLLDAFLQVLAGASDIPATRFMGQSPKGMNATGESDIRNYYDGISDAQEDGLEPQLIQFGPILSRSAIGEEIKGLTVEFNPLYQESEEETSKRRKTDTEIITMLLDRGVITDEEARSDMAERSLVSNLDEAVEGEEITDTESKKVFKYHIELGIVTQNEAREKLGLGPVPGGDEFLVPGEIVSGDEFEE